MAMASEVTPQDTERAPVLPVTVLVADDNLHFRTGMVRALRAHGEFTVVADVDDGAQAYEAIGVLRPEIALLDARMPIIDGLAVAKMVSGDPAYAGTRVVVLSAQADSTIAAEVRAAGAHAFLDKTQPRRAICEALLVVAGRLALD